MAEQQRVLVVGKSDTLAELGTATPPGAWVLAMAESREEAEEHLQAEEFSVVLVDRGLPDGERIAASIASERPDLSVFLVLPPSEKVPDEEPARDKGLEGLIPGPISLERIDELVEAVGRSRRRHRRVGVSIDVDYSAGDDVFVEKSVNLSMGGMFISTGNPLPAGTAVSLRFTIPDAEPIEVRGEVTWVQSLDPDGPPDQHPGMGIRFDDLSQKDARTLRTFLVRRLEQLEV
jgi:uncharacterized protein (TIGR02266 family)